MLLPLLPFLPHLIASQGRVPAPAIPKRRIHIMMLAVAASLNQFPPPVTTPSARSHPRTNLGALREDGPGSEPASSRWCPKATICRTKRLIKKARQTAWLAPVTRQTSLQNRLDRKIDAVRWQKERISAIAPWSRAFQLLLRFEIALPQRLGESRDFLRIFELEDF